MFGKMIGKIVNSKDYNEFLKLIGLYHKLEQQAQEAKDSNLLAMVELEMLNASELIGVAIRKWKTDEKFQKELFSYIKENILENKHSGLPATNDFIRENEEFLIDLFDMLPISSEKDEPEEVELNEEVKDEFKSLMKKIRKFKKLYEFKRKVRMKPFKEVNFSFDSKTYTELIENNYFTEVEIEKFVSKLNKDKTKLFEILEKSKDNTVEFYKEEMGNILTKSLNSSEYYFPNIVASKNYYLVMSGKNVINDVNFLLANKAN